MSKTKTNDERADFLQGLGLNPGKGSLADLQQPARQVPTSPTAPSLPNDIALAPPGVDPRAMPVDEIVFDPRLLEAYPSLAADQGGKDASRYIFSLYQSYGRNKDRNGALHRKISSFITHTRRQRETGGMVKEKVKSTKGERDIAALIASQGVEAGELAEALQLLAEKRKEKEA